MRRERRALKKSLGRSLFSQRALSQRSIEARPLVERLKKAGCRFVQLEMPENNGYLCGKWVPLEKGLSPSGTGITTLLLTFKSGGHICFTSPFANMDNSVLKFVAMPDLSTAVALPWKHDVAGILCDYYMNDGTPCAVSPRQILKNAEDQLQKLGYTSRVALEYEMYIVEEDDALMRAGRFGELSSFGREWDAYSISRTPSYEALAKEFMRRCEAVGIPIEAFHTELGRGMFEYTFEPQPALKAADDAVRAKLYLRELCAERGLAATYMTAKFVGTGDSYCGCHHNFSLARGQKNVFWDEAKGDLSQIARHAAAGLLKTMPAYNILYRPWVNSFRRMDRMMWNPENASWGKDNHTAALRVVTGAVPRRMTRFEHRAPGADINPYLTVASLLFGVIEGLKDGKEPPAYGQGDVTREKRWASLPHSMPEAVAAWSNSPSARASFGKGFVEHYAYLKREEWKDFTGAVEEGEAALKRGPVTPWEFVRYFNHA
jgi:glutamine synthetase